MRLSPYEQINMWKTYGSVFCGCGYVYTNTFKEKRKHLKSDVHKFFVAKMEYDENQQDPVLPKTKKRNYKC